LFAKNGNLQALLVAINGNDTVPESFTTGIYTIEPSQPTISNALNVANLSTFLRIQALYSRLNIVLNDFSFYL
jgi:hypothetical protein